MREIISRSAQETKETARGIAKSLHIGQVFCLFGELGSGKTTFTQGLGQYFGLKRIISPTFILHRSYRLKKRGKIKFLHHIDLYRLQNSEEISVLGLSDFIEREDSVTIIEWPEKITGLLPKKRREIYFEYLTDQERKIIVKDEK